MNRLLKYITGEVLALKYLLTIDQGTTGTTAIIWDEDGLPLARVNREHRQFYPQPGWVEHDAGEIWSAVVDTAGQALEEAAVRPAQIAAIGVTNQRETCVFWDRATGKPLSRAIVWQCRRTASLCEELRAKGYEDLFRQRTGLILDPYFSGTKLSWALQNIEAVREASAEGRLAFGTIDSWLIYNFTGGKVHATDYSNASRTLLFDLHRLEWNPELLKILDVPAEVLPRVLPSSGIFGMTAPDSFLGMEVPIGGVAGDQQAALFGQACFEPGMAKNTYGTGSFLLMNTGKKIVSSRAGLLTTVAWGLEGEVEYALEGSVFITGAAIQWLRDELGIIEKASEVEALSRAIPDTGGVYFVPAFVGLGAPYWDPYARGLIIGITRGTGRAHIARAAVEAMAFQSRDVLELMNRESGISLKEIRVDGGAAANDFLLQFQADLINLNVRRPATLETTSLGAAYLAGLAVGVWKSREEIADMWKEDACFESAMGDVERKEHYRRWKAAVERSLKWEDTE